MANRPAIPADIERRVLIEAGHRCAIPTCRHIVTEIHHIVPWATCEKHEYENLIALCPNCHSLAGLGKIDRKSLRIYKAKLRYAHDKYSFLEIDILFALSSRPENAPIQWPEFNLLLIKRLTDSNFVVCRSLSLDSISILGMPASPLNLFITEEGRSFIRSIGPTGHQID